MAGPSSLKTPVGTGELVQPQAKAWTRGARDWAGEGGWLHPIAPVQDGLSRAPLTPSCSVLSACLPWLPAPQG